MIIPTGLFLLVNEPGEDFLPHRKSVLAPGKNADFCILDNDINIKPVIVYGEMMADNDSLYREAIIRS
ncbi:MAG: hypothetical protein FWD78_08860 [Treponema sp.]|nr:hypothetical protein [Treponema sp.]